MGSLNDPARPGRGTAGRMPLALAVFALLAGPTTLAFFTGGYFDEARNWAGVGAWALVFAALLLRRNPLPRTRAVLAGLGGLALLAAWTLASITWALIPGYAYHAGQIALLYLGALIAATLLLRERVALRALEPALLSGIVIVIGYGISERLLPGLLHFNRSLTAGGRLEQPLTYWNAMGELAAIGLVLATRVAGDASRPLRLRALAAAAAAPVGLGLYLTFSRGALYAAVAGLVALIVLAARREQLRTLAVTLAATVICSAVAAPFGGVTGLSGSEGTRETQGAIVLAVLLVVALAAAGVQALLAARETPAPLRLPRRASMIATALICAGLAVAIVVGSRETSKEQLGGGASRLTTLQSDRYSYWSVALRAFGDEPLHGIGAENWWTYWLRYRHTDAAALDAHSLELQTLAELGLVGAAFLLVFFVGTGVAAREAYRRAPELAAGPLAGVIVWLVHSPLDWDWQMPALTLVAMGLAGGLLALRESQVAAVAAEPGAERTGALPSDALAQPT